jgi:hypothetical protein
MARFVAERYTMVSCGRCEYKGVMFGRKGWFDANSTDEAIEKLHAIMSDTTYILKIETEQGFKPFYKAAKKKDGTIKVLRDDRKIL